jgi:hypothetical protein
VVATVPRIDVTTLTAERATGTFTFTAEFTSGSGSQAQRVVTNGSFNVTF